MMPGSLLFFLFAVLAVTVAQKNPHCANGRGVIVHLFEWKWTDIALECERFLGPRGFCGVQVSPPNEHIAVWEPSYNPAVKRPWYERYQPVSYKLVSRSGNEEEFADMVSRCNNVDVRVYVDGVINHMVGAGSGKGVGGSPYDADAQSFPGVPYGINHFHTKQDCGTRSCDIENYGNASQVRNCRLSGLLDLNQGLDYVRNRIIDFMNRCINHGVAGFRIDGAKHMKPDDLSYMFSRLDGLNTKWFPSNSVPFIYQEVIDLGGDHEPIKASDYLSCGQVTEFKYGMSLGHVIRKQNYQKMKYLKNFGQGWGMLQDGDALVFVVNHNKQRSGDEQNPFLTFFESRMHKMANAFMLAFPYGQPRIMSSYSWHRNIQGGKDINGWIGPPHNDDWSTQGVSINAHHGTCDNGWVCEHRWRQIYHMVAFRNNVSGTALENWWDNWNNQIAFGRGNRGFIAFNNEDGAVMNVTLQTGLPAGQYCDVISGEMTGSTCSGKTITVDGSGKADFNIDAAESDPMIAIHVGQSLPKENSYALLIGFIVPSILLFILFIVS